MIRHSLVFIICASLLIMSGSVAVVIYSIVNQIEEAQQEVPIEYYSQDLASIPPFNLNENDSYNILPHLDYISEDTILKIAKYILGTDYGFVSVFYNTASDQNLALKERTSTPTDTLPMDERRRLSKGIPVYSEEQLVKLLQDYGS
ncbi:MAG: hypothetical protein FWC91_04915 [Defluviitaleaceae bacterium]|nr:hypothetical protein [Defluviitaleaceae bacterium]